MKRHMTVLTALAALTASTALLSGSTGAARASEGVQPVPLADAGTILGWGPGQPLAWTLPAELDDEVFTAAVAGGPYWTLALTAEGRVKVIGASDSSVQVAEIPAQVSNAEVTAIAANNDMAGVLVDGRPVLWPASLGSVADVPSDLTGVEQFDFRANWGAAVRTDGTVATWGSDPLGWGYLTVPAGLTGVTKVAIGASAGFALKDDGTVVAWGRAVQGQLDLPPALTVPGNVTDIAVGNQGAIALLTDGTVVTWGQQAALYPPPGDLSGKTITHVGADGTYWAALDSEGGVHQWGQVPDAAFATPPAALADADVSAFSYGQSHMVALVAELNDVTAPAISGTPKVGESLIGTAATFSGTPTVSNQWLADGAAIAGATGLTLDLTDELVGKSITFRSTATQGAETAESTSDPTGPVAPDIVASTLAVTATGGTYGAGGTATVTVSAEGGATATGAVTITANGTPAGAAQLNGGKATVALPGTLAPGQYTLAASYAGSVEVSASAGSTLYAVAKAGIGAPTFKLKKAPTTRKKGKAIVTVTAPPGLAAATGAVTVTLKHGKKAKTMTATLAGGTATVKLPKLAKGKWKGAVTYNGDVHYQSATAPVKVKVKR